MWKELYLERGCGWWLAYSLFHSVAKFMEANERRYEKIQRMLTNNVTKFKQKM